MGVKFTKETGEKDVMHNVRQHFTKKREKQQEKIKQKLMNEKNWKHSFDNYGEEVYSLVIKKENFKHVSNKYYEQLAAEFGFKAEHTYREGTFPITYSACVFSTKEF